MPTAQATIHIDAPPEAVFDFVADAPRIPEYVRFVHDVFEVSDQPPRLGTVIREHAKPGPMRVTTTWRIGEFERPRRQVWVGRQDDMEMTLTKLTEPEAGGTRYTQDMEYRYPPQIRPLGWLLERLVVARRMNEEFVTITRGIKRIVEAERGKAVEAVLPSPGRRGREALTETTSPAPSNQPTRRRRHRRVRQTA